MFDSITGTIESIADGKVALNCGGIGWELIVSKHCAEQLSLEQSERLLTHLSVSENSMLLYGFKDSEERGVFRHLIQVSKIGPSSAMNLLSHSTPSNLVTAVLNGDIDSLCAVKGIGRKTAERMVLELRDKLELPASQKPNTSPSVEPAAEDLVRVLSQLGFNPSLAQSAAQEATTQLGPNADFEDLLRLSLNYANK